MEPHLENIPRDLLDKRSQETGFRKQQFWRPVELDLLIRLMPLWMERVHRYPKKNELGGGEMDPKTEELGYKLMLEGPQLDFYLNAFAKRIARKMRLNYLSGQVKIFGITCPPEIWWYFVILAKKYGAEVDFNLPRQGDVIKTKTMSTFKALISPQRVGKLVYEKAF